MPASVRGNDVIATLFRLSRASVLLVVRYEGGRFVMRRKSIQAKELIRVAKEQVAKRLVYGEDSQ